MVVCKHTSLTGTHLGIAMIMINTHTQGNWIVRATIYEEGKEAMLQKQDWREEE